MDGSEALEPEQSESFVDVVPLGIRHAFLQTDLHPNPNHTAALLRASAPPS